MGSIVNPLEAVLSKLGDSFPRQVFRESDAHYKTIQDSYWSGTQKDLRPFCFFQPLSADELAFAVEACVAADVPFGVKSGGHGHYAGQSCLDAGIQFDLCRLNSITLTPEKRTVRVGAGCTWRSIYEVLEPQGVTAVGGRSADVGVGGFLIGGGISFYAAEHGWGVDNVLSFQVVLASGQVARASPESNPTLFRALRGGGANFGIITEFELKTVDYTGIWGGRTTVVTHEADTALSAYVDFIPKLRQDPKGHTIIIFDSHRGQLIVRQYIVYTRPIPDLPMFDRLRSVPTIDSDIGLTNYSTIAADIANLQNGHGFRHAVSTMTIVLDEALLQLIVELYKAAAATVSHCAAGCLEFHALPLSPDPEGNVYNLGSEDKPLIAVMLAFSTPHRRYDYTLIALQQRVLDEVKVVAEERGLYHPFLFANYAGPFQDVIGSYGPQTTKVLSSVARDYDPSSTFQRLQPGGFKLGVTR